MQCGLECRRSVGRRRRWGRSHQGVWTMRGDSAHPPPVLLVRIGLGYISCKEDSERGPLGGGS